MFSGGEEAAGGIYFSFRDLGFVTVPPEGAVLSGGAGHRYLRTPALLVLLVSPLLGAGLALSLPFLGLVVLVVAVWRRLART